MPHDALSNVLLFGRGGTSRAVPDGFRSYDDGRQVRSKCFVRDGANRKLAWKLSKSASAVARIGHDLTPRTLTIGQSLLPDQDQWPLSTSIEGNKRHTAQHRKYVSLESWCVSSRSMLTDADRNRRKAHSWVCAAEQYNSAFLARRLGNWEVPDLSKVGCRVTDHPLLSPSQVPPG